MGYLTDGRYSLSLCLSNNQIFKRHTHTHETQSGRPWAEESLLLSTKPCGAQALGGDDLSKRIRRLARRRCTAPPLQVWPPQPAQARVAGSGHAAGVHPLCLSRHLLSKSPPLALSCLLVLGAQKSALRVREAHPVFSCSEAALRSQQPSPLWGTCMPRSEQQERNR